MVAETRTYNYSLNQVLEASVRALKNCEFAVTEQSSNIIKASTRASFRSWGENIQVKLFPITGGTKVDITSKPVFGIFDWGKSSENVRNIFSEISRELGALNKKIEPEKNSNSQKASIGKSVVSVSAEKRFCRYCGAEHKADAIFCTKCGKKISELVK